MRHSVIAGIAASVILCSGFAAVAGPQDDMMATDRAFSAMSIEKGARAAFLAYMTDDVRLYDGDRPPIIGKAAVAAYYAKNPDAPGTRLEWTPAEAEASPDGLFGLTRGTWIYTAKQTDGRLATATGYYVTVWRRQPGGQYKFALDIGGADKKPKAE